MSKKTIIRAKKSNPSKRWTLIALASIAVLAILWSFFGNGPRIPIHAEKGSNDQ